MPDNKRKPTKKVKCDICHRSYVMSNYARHINGKLHTIKITNKFENAKNELPMDNLLIFDSY
jgi:hypothetical protein